MATHREIVYVRAPDDAVPAALINMLSGGNIGKQVVRLAAASA